MATQVQIRRGTTAEHATFTGAVGELSVDTDKDTVVVHDGALAGGHPMLKQDGSNSALALGSAGTPSLKFTGDPNTGIYSPGADQVSVATGGTERLRIDASGQIEAVSLGTAAAPTFSWTGDPNTGIYSPGADQVAISTNGTGRLFIQSNGVVRSPIGFEIGSDPSYIYQGNSDQLVIRVGADGPYAEFADLGSSILRFGNTSGPLVFTANATERMRLDSSGRLGLGTSSPSFTLDVTGTFRSTGEGRFDNGINLKTATLNYVYFDDALAFSRNGTGERMRLDSSGRLGLGTSSPSDKLTVADGNLRVNGSNSSPVLLTVAANASATGGVNRCSVDFIDAAGTGGCVLRAAHDGGFFDLRTRVAGVETPRIAVEYGTGRVGIGNTAPSEALDVSGVIRRTNTGSAGYYFRGYRSSTTSAFYIYDDGTDIQLTNEQSGALQFRTANAERARIDSSGRLLVGTSTARSNFFNASWTPQAQVEGTSDATSSLSISQNFNGEQGPVLLLGKSRGTVIGSNTIVQSADSLGLITFQGADGSEVVESARIQCFVDGTPGANDMPGRLVFSTTADGASSPTERVRITNSGEVRIANTAGLSVISSTDKGFVVENNGTALIVRDDNVPLFVGRQTSDGILVSLRQAGVEEGSISVSGATVSYNGAHLSRWSQLPGGATREEILRGSVLSNIDEMCAWGEEDNEQLNRMKVSDVEGDPNVAGVFQGWDDDDDTYTDDFYCAMTGDFIIRIAEGVSVQRGDLLMSAGDGTAKPQGDDIVRSKTVAKVTSTHVTCTYDDGSYCVPCVLMAC